MTIDRSLRLSNALARSRNVLTRAQRIEELERSGKFSEGDSPFGLPKVRVLKVKKRGKKKKKKEEGDEK